MDRRILMAGPFLMRDRFFGSLDMMTAYI